MSTADHVSAGSTPPVAPVTPPSFQEISNTPTVRTDTAAMPTFKGASTNYDPPQPPLSERRLTPTTVVADNVNLNNLQVMRKDQNLYINAQEKACSTRLRTQIIYGTIIGLAVIGVVAAIAATAIFASPVAAVLVAGVGLVGGAALVTWGAYGLAKALDANPQTLADAQRRLLMIDTALKRLEDSEKDEYSFNTFLLEHFRFTGAKESGAQIDDMSTYLDLYDRKLKLLEDEKESKELEKAAPRLEAEIQELEDKISDLEGKINDTTQNAFADYSQEKVILENEQDVRRNLQENLKNTIKQKEDLLKDQALSPQDQALLKELEEDEKELQNMLAKLDTSKERIEELDTILKASPEKHIENLKQDIANLQSQIDMGKQKKQDVEEGKTDFETRLKAQHEKQHIFVHSTLPPAAATNSAPTNPSNVQATPLDVPQQMPPSDPQTPPIPTILPPPIPTTTTTTTTTSDASNSVATPTDQPPSSVKARKPLPPPPSSLPPSPPPPADKVQGPPRPPKLAKKPPPPSNTAADAAANNTTPGVTVKKPSPPVPQRPIKNTTKPPSDPTTE